MVITNNAYKDMLSWQEYDVKLLNLDESSVCIIHLPAIHTTNQIDNWFMDSVLTVLKDRYYWIIPVGFIHPIMYANMSMFSDIVWFPFCCFWWY